MATSRSCSSCGARHSDVGEDDGGDDDDGGDGGGGDGGDDDDGGDGGGGDDGDDGNEDDSDRVFGLVEKSFQRFNVFLNFWSPWEFPETSR